MMTVLPSPAAAPTALFSSPLRYNDMPVSTGRKSHRLFWFCLQREPCFLFLDTNLLPRFWPPRFRNNILKFLCVVVEFHKTLFSSLLKTELLQPLSVRRTECFNLKHKFIYVNLHMHDFFFYVDGTRDNLVKLNLKHSPLLLAKHYIYIYLCILCVRR